MKLYSMAGTCALSVHIVLEWIGEPFDVEMLSPGANRSPRYLGINPGGQVPSLQLDDGQVLTQASAILMFLADTHLQARVDSAADGAFGRAKLAETLAYLTSDVHVAFGPIFNPGRFLDDQSQHEALKAEARERVAHYMAELDRRLGPVDMLLRTRSVADAYLYVLTRWVDLMPEGLRPFANLWRFRRAMEQDQAVLRALSAEGLAACR